MKKTTLLKTMLMERKALPCPGVYDALSAIMAQDAGFKAVQISGYGICASTLGLTDYSTLEVRGMEQRYVNDVVVKRET